MKLPKHKCGLYLEHNAHKDYYETTESALETLLLAGDIDKKTYDECLESDSIWSLRWYPETPVGYCIVYASDLESLLSAAKVST